MSPKRVRKTVLGATLGVWVAEACVPNVELEPGLESGGHGGDAGETETGSAGENAEAGAGSPSRGGESGSGASAGAADSGGAASSNAAGGTTGDVDPSASGAGQGGEPDTASGGASGQGGAASASCVPLLGSRRTLVYENGYAPERRWVDARGYYFVDMDSEFRGFLRFLDAERTSAFVFSPLLFQRDDEVSGGTPYGVVIGDLRVLITTRLNPNAPAESTLFDVGGNLVSTLPPNLSLTGAAFEPAGTALLFTEATSDAVMRWDPPGEPEAIITLGELGLTCTNGDSAWFHGVSGDEWLVRCGSELYVVSPSGGPARDLADLSVAYPSPFRNETGLLLERGGDNVADEEYVALATGTRIDLVPAIRALPTPSDCPENAHFPKGHGALFRDRYVYPAEAGLFSVSVDETGVHTLRRLTDDPVVWPVVTPDGVLFAREDVAFERYAVHRYDDRIP